MFENAKRLTVSEIVGLTNANRNTVKVRLRELVAIDKLELVGKGRGAFYRRKIN